MHKLRMWISRRTSFYFSSPPSFGDKKKKVAKRKGSKPIGQAKEQQVTVGAMETMVQYISTGFEARLMIQAAAHQVEIDALVEIIQSLADTMASFSRATARGQPEQTTTATALHHQTPRTTGATPICSTEASPSVAPSQLGLEAVWKEFSVEDLANIDEWIDKVEYGDGPRMGNWCFDDYFNGLRTMSGRFWALIQTIHSWPAVP